MGTSQKGEEEDSTCLGIYLIRIVACIFDRKYASSEGDEVEKFRMGEAIRSRRWSRQEPGCVGDEGARMTHAGSWTVLGRGLYCS